MATEEQAYEHALIVNEWSNNLLVAIEAKRMDEQRLVNPKLQQSTRDDVLAAHESTINEILAAEPTRLAD